MVSNGPPMTMKSERPVSFLARPLTRCMAMDWKLFPFHVQFPHLPTAAVNSSWRDCWETELENAGTEAGAKPGTLC